jgi:glycerol-3-phosphate O-acyltransferase/dihydroxyacetone phosphate acyltransferase
MNTYGVVKGIATYATDMMFRDIDVINAEEVPREGPLIIYGNHNNQYIDGMVHSSCYLATNENDT